MNRFGREDAGFTFIELIIVMCTIWVLAALSMHNYGLYKEKIYRNQTQDVITQLRTAVESAKISLGVASSPAEWSKWVSASREANQALLGDASLLSGYAHDPNMQILVDHNGICDAGFWGDFCTVTSITARHCKSNLYKTWRVLRNGTVFQFEWVWGNDPCAKV